MRFARWRSERWWSARRSERRRARPRRAAASVLLLAFVAVIAATARPGTASAHALLRSSQPAAGATLGSGPPSVTLSFSEAPDPRLTSVRVLDSGGGDHVAGPIEALADPAESVRAPIGELGDGVYTVSWRTVSSVDGHVSAGSFVFGVGVAPPSGSPDQPTGGASQSGSPPGIVARWALYLGLVGLIGAAFVAFAVAGPRAPDLLAVAALGWLLTAAGTVGVVAVQWIETGAPLEALPSTSVGLTAFARTAALALVGLAIVALAVVPRLAGRAGWAAVGVTSALALGIDVMTGHAAAGAAWLQQVTVQWIHGLGAAAWVGGLAALLVLLRSTPAGDRLATARRFSRWAGIALVVVALTGVVRAVGEVGTLEALLGTDFGRVVLVKTALLLGLAGLGALNRYVTLRDAARVVTGLRRIGGLEVTLGVAVLGFSALLVNLTPPTSAGGPVEPAARPIVATGSDFGTSVRARLIASPGPAGSNDFDLAVVDYDSGEPVDAAAAELRFELVSQAGVAPSSLSLERAAPGSYHATGANLSIDGIWRLTATIAVAGGAVEVLLLAATTVPPQPVERLVSPGLPTISTIQLGASGSAQVYLDPGGEGPNELHVTFFDRAGMALPVETVTIAAFPGAGGAQLPAPRLLQPGHFVAAMDAVPGELAVDAIGRLPDGGQVHLHVTIEVEP